MSSQTETKPQTVHAGVQSKVRLLHVTVLGDYYIPYSTKCYKNWVKISFMKRHNLHDAHEKQSL